MSSTYLAPEWERQDAIILVWPHANSDWSVNLPSIENTYCELANHISLHQYLIIIAYNSAHEIYLHQTLSKHSISEDNILIICIPSNDTWVRDYGPLTIKTNSSSKLLNFKFDAWGEKYAFQKDNDFNSVFCEKLNITTACEQIDFVLEGGNVEVNARGELLSSLSCFSRQAGPNLTQSNLEEKMQIWFGTDQIYWIDVGKLQGDDTDGHIDTLARFCSDDIIVYSATNNTHDQNTQMLRSLHSQLESISLQSKNQFELVPLPLPNPIFVNHKQLPASYANFLITNHKVLVPTFEDKQDSHALQTLQDIFPTREVVGINSLSLIQQLGGLHCATVHLPANTLAMGLK